MIPIGTTIALFFGVVIIFESFVQVEKKKKNRNQFQKSRLESSKFRKLLYFPIIRPVIIVFPMFAAIFISTYAISLIFLDNIMAFIISENVAAIISLLIANIIEKKYAKVQRY